MSVSSRWITLAASASLMTCVVAAPLFGQDSEKASTSEPAAKIELNAEELAKIESAAKRMPAYFGQIALNPDQRARIVEIQRSRVRRITELQKEIAALKQESLRESETVLTQAQKDLLANLRKTKAEQSKKKDDARPATPAPSNETPKKPAP